MKAIHGLAAVLVIATASVASAQQIHANVNGKQVAFYDVQPMMMQGRIMVPIRGVFEEMGANLKWNAYTETVTATTPETNMTLRVGDRFALVNGREITLDSPAVMVRNRVLVPLRFVSESLGANVDWDARTLTAYITTMGEVRNPPYPTDPPNYKMATFESGTVLPFKLDRRLSSDYSVKGDTFTATLVTDNNLEYEGLPSGTTLMGHVDVVKAKTNRAPGVLGLAFDKIRLPDGRTYTIDGTLIGLDRESVTNEDGKIVARASAKRDLKYVGIGAGAGALLAIVTKGNILTNALIGGALGFLWDELQRNPERSNNVNLQAGTEFGVRLEKDHSFRIMTATR